MSSENLEKLRYPIGKFSVPVFDNPEILSNAIQSISALPEILNSKLNGLKKEDFELRYRPDGWTIRELIHHIAESHTHAYIRFKWALTEDKPLIKPYFEERCAQLEDYKTMPVEYSIDFINVLHKRFAFLLNTLSTEQFDRKFLHPEWDIELDLKINTTLYAWHGEHHLAHIDLAKANK